MVSGITLIVLSILAVPSLLLAKKPDAKELLAKISPYQGWIGLVFCFWGIYGIVFQGLLGLGWLPTWPIYWITALLGNIVQAVLGFILGFGTISTYVLSKNEEAKKKGAELLAKLAPIQGKLGIFGIAVGIWTIVASFLFYGV
ncbi:MULTISPECIES: hypothetical protein [Leptospira]|uniref:Uncharacterized protein n=4 Tax=Leptospira kirschneri TaxID=29507 RepID=A0A1T1DV52_9LEPT|nr:MULTISPECIES: hypothetical protein [Leptospira]EMO74311.1 hypothetical protein LEP1GSC127_4205 [Leptospira kirschneri str. 200801925]EJO70321.1 hypothetical protein LEP1GSC044_1082 [Leptospira kirschneri serovar Grippotyphosa str. RM52]EKO16851.1 hypothetical protein LEP1GSC081_2698 [Leptospira kirschneri str. H1]EKO52349.1 hypothetical protein LEP1GSC131_4486 [Leptospira kirschneri str. 200802841]EKO59336.1 hypothetical protein LEP1GSC082_4091 [Leptospira kirschneri str. H2]